MKGQADREMEVPVLLHSVHPVYLLSTQSRLFLTLSTQTVGDTWHRGRVGKEVGPSDRTCAFCKQTIIASLKKMSFPISNIKHLKSPVKEGCGNCPPPQGGGRYDNTGSKTEKHPKTVGLPSKPNPVEQGRAQTQWWS